MLAVNSSLIAIYFREGALLGVDSTKLCDKYIGPDPVTGSFANAVAAHFACDSELDFGRAGDRVPAHKMTIGARCHCAFGVVYVCRIVFALMAPIGCVMPEEAVLEYTKSRETSNYNADKNFERREVTDGRVVPGCIIASRELDHPFQT